MSGDRLEALTGLMRLNYKAHIRARRELAETEQQQTVIFQLVADELQTTPENIRYDASSRSWVKLEKGPEGE